MATEASHTSFRRETILLLIALLLFGSGLLAMRLGGDSSGRLATDAYRLLLLFALNGDWVFRDVDNLWLRVLAFLAPLFTVMSIVELVSRTLWRRVHTAFVLAGLRQHQVIVGLTEHSLLLAISLSANPANGKVVLVDRNPDPDRAARARRHGLLLVTGDPGKPATLQRVRLASARHAVAFLEQLSDALQLVINASDVLRQSRKHSGKAGAVASSSLDFWIEVKELPLGLQLGAYFSFAELTEYVHPRFFSLAEIAVRRILRQHPPDFYADAMGQQQVHLAVYGFTRTAAQIIQESVRQVVTLSANRLRITLLSNAPADDREHLLALMPALETLVDLDVRKLSVYRTGIAEHDYLTLPEQVSVHVVCLDDPEQSACVALALRRLLLTPPEPFRAQRRQNAPILLRLDSREGIAQLLQSNPGLPPSSSSFTSLSEDDIPDGLFPFGMVEDFLSTQQGDPFHPTVLDHPREEIAKFLHFSYQLDSQMQDPQHPLSNAKAGTPIYLRTQRNWQSLPPEFRESCRQAADHIWTKARIIRCRVLRHDAAASNMPLDLSVEETTQLAISEHQRWVNERLLNGWALGEKRVDAARRHPWLRPWHELRANATVLDHNLVTRLRQAMQYGRLDLRRELMIGVVGHRLGQQRNIDADYIRQQLRSAIQQLIQAQPDRAPVLITSLADGTDSIAAELALELKIPYLTPLPLPYEALRQDFEQADGIALQRFLKLVAGAERHFELPLKFGDLVDVSRAPGQRDDPPARVQQYALAGAWIAERCDVLLAVWDGLPAQGHGGTADIVQWRQQGEVPECYRTPAIHYRRPNTTDCQIIRPAPEPGRSA